MKLEDYIEISSRCSQCNFCQASCPVYRVKGTENWLARNRLNLIREVLIDKTMEDTPRFREILDTCLLCTGCTQNCSSMVPVDEIIISAKSRLTESKTGISSVKKKLISGVIKNSSIINFMGRAGAVAQKLGLISDNIPKLSSKPFSSRLSGTLKPKGEVQGRVAYYTGCGTNFIYPETGEAVADILLGLNNEVIIPEGLTCCGVPLLSEGDIEGAAETFRKNIEILAAIECDKIIMDCTSCMMMFIKIGIKLFDADDPVTENVKSVNEKIENALNYIHRTGGDKFKKQSVSSFTYHVPCHLNKSLGETCITAEMLSDITGAEYREMDEPELCCGAGGTYYMKDIELSESLLKLKVTDIKKTGAPFVVTECPMCKFYIRKGIPDIEVLHPVEYIQRNIKTQ